MVVKVIVFVITIFSALVSAQENPVLVKSSKLKTYDVEFEVLLNDEVLARPKLTLMLDDQAHYSREDRRIQGKKNESNIDAILSRFIESQKKRYRLNLNLTLVANNGEKILTLKPEIVTRLGVVKPDYQFMVNDRDKVTIKGLVVHKNKTTEVKSLPF